jgi:hypothetical protein
MRTWRCLLAVMGWGWLMPAAFAQDRVTFIPPGSSRPLVLIGEVLDVTGETVKVRTPNSVQSILPNSVTDIETIYDPAHLRGVELFRNGETSLAQDSFRDALDREPRAWVDREILSLMVKCDLRQQDLLGALRDFRLILASDPTTRHWGIAPLVWSPLAISEAVQSEMRLWLRSGRPEDELLAASVLLLDPGQAEAARTKLENLSSHQNSTISALSRAQLWRIPIEQHTVADTMLEDWEDQIRRLNTGLKAGPQYLLARGYESRGDFRRAAAEALWIPYVYSESEVLAARALFDAAEALNKTGLVNEARILDRELAQRFPWSREAGLVRSRQKRVES